MSAGPSVLLREEKIQSYFKHRFLHHYAPQFAYKLGRGRHEVVIIDGFAGPATSGDGAPGSGGLLLDLGVAHPNMQVRLMEKRPDYVKTLEQLAADYHGKTPDRKPWITVISGNTEDNLRGVVAAESARHVLMYLDPCGYGLSFENLIGIMKSRQSWPRTEVMLNFGSGLIERVGGAYFKGASDGGKLTSACGGDWWKSVAEPHLLRDGDWSNALEAVLKGFTSRLRESLGTHVVAVPIRSNPRTRPMFHMVCSTFSGVGLVALGDSFAKAWDDWALEGARRAQVGTLFEDDEQLTVPPDATRDVCEAKVRFRGDVTTWIKQGNSGKVADNADCLLAGTLGRLTEVEVGQELRAMSADRLIKLDKTKRASGYSLSAPD